MELRLQKFISSMGVLSDIRNLDPLNPTIFKLEHPVTATLYVTIAAVTEPSHLGIPINTTWVVLDPSNPYYLKALKLKGTPTSVPEEGVEPLPGFNQTWIEITTYDEIFADPQYYDQPGGIPGPKGDKGDKGDPGTSPVLDYQAIADIVAGLIQPAAPTLAIAGASNVAEATNSQYIANLVVSGVSNPVTAVWSLSVGARASINSAGLLVAQALTDSQPIVLTATYLFGGTTLTATKNITLGAAILTGLSITGVPATLYEGQTFVAVAHASFQGIPDAVVTPVWEITPPSAGVITAGGVFTASLVAADTPFTVTATYAEAGNPFTATAQGSVINIIPTGVNITGQQTVFESLQATYVATVTRNNGSTTFATVFTLSDPAAGTIDTLGVFTAALVTADTPCTITATYTADGVTVTDTFDITVINLVPTALTISGDSQVFEGGTVQYTAIADSNNGTSAPVTPTWSVSPAGAGSINSSGLFQSALVNADVQATISASFTFSGVTVTDTQSVEVTNIVPVSLTVTADPTDITEGQTTQVVAVVTRNDGTSDPVTPTWTRSPTSGGAIAAGGLFTAAQVNADTPVTITGSYTNAGVTVTGNTVVNVADVPVLMTPYFGVAATNAVKNEALILSLANRGPTNDRLNDSFQLIDGPGQNMFYAYPASYGLATFTDLGNGFQGGWDGAAGAGDGLTLGPITVSVGGVPFYLYKTDQSNISPIGNPTNWRVT